MPRLFSLQVVDVAGISGVTRKPVALGYCPQSLTAG